MCAQSTARNTDCFDKGPRLNPTLALSEAPREWVSGPDIGGPLSRVRAGVQWDGGEE